MKRAQWGDFTADFRQMYAPPSPMDEGKREMYSYQRPAYIFWSAFMNGLIAAGFSEQAAREWLCSKGARHMLDGAMSEKLERLAFNFARKHGEDFYTREQCEEWARETKAQATA